jgi:hypothetical protein
MMFMPVVSEIISFKEFISVSANCVA